MPVPSAKLTSASAVSQGAETAIFVPSRGAPQSGFDEELRRLLRGRLLLVHLLALVLIVLLAAMIRLTPMAEQEGIIQPRESHFWARLAAQFAEAAIGTFALSWFSGMTLRSLRLWELAFFITYAAAAGLNRFEVLASPIEGAAGNVPALAMGFNDLTSLQGFIILILAYGVLIPNTRRRSLLLVAVLTAVPLAIIPAAAVANPLLREGRGLALIAQSALCLTFPAAIAIFAASRAFGLQRRAFEAERRAEQIDQYTLKRKLGEGSMGEVWLAEHRLLKRPCAVKFIRGELAAHPAIAARFAREVQAATALTHPNTVRVYDYGRAADGTFYFVMEYLDGPTLEELVGRTGPLPPGRVVYLLRQLCGALAEAHAAGLVHRDLKPGNVIVATLGGQRDVAKLLDFGLVQDLSADAEGRLTRTGTVLGTPDYMSPEQATGELAVDAAATCTDSPPWRFSPSSAARRFRARPSANFSPRTARNRRRTFPNCGPTCRPTCPQSSPAVWQKIRPIASRRSPPSTAHSANAAAPPTGRQSGLPSGGRPKREVVNSRRRTTGFS